MEMQFYPPGYPPFADSISCDDTHWCAALNIDSLACTEENCNPNCEEPVNFAFITKNGIPTGPPSPQDSNLYSATPNADTFLMNPGDTIKVHMWDAGVPESPGEKAFEVKITDMTTHTTGWMQASADNGFTSTSMIDCSGEPFDFQPEYNTAAPNNVTPWGADPVNISTEYETGHWEACTSLSQPSKISLGMGISDTFWNSCAGPYENSDKDQDGGSSPETGDALCYPKGDTHGTQGSNPDTVTGCLANYYQNGDLDFDGQPYWKDWPTGTTPTSKLPSSFTEDPPTTNGHQYQKFLFTTDIALSEYECGPDSLGKCTVPPDGPGHFYPYWSLAKSGGTCSIYFGDVSSGVNDFGKDAQYGTNRYQKWGYPQFASGTHANTCSKGSL
jgi:hypothetical protein